MGIKNFRNYRGVFKIKHLFTALLCMVLASCAGSVSHTLKVDPAGASAAVRTNKYDDAGHKIVAALSSGKREAFNSAILKKTLLDRTFHGMSRDSRIVKKARVTLDIVLDQAGILIAKNLGENTQLTFVRSRPVNGEHRALVRVDMGDRGLSFMDFVLGKDEKGDVRIVDWHDYSQGQLYSDSLRQALVLMLPHDTLLNAKLFGDAIIDRKTVEQFSELAGFSREKKYKLWLEKYGSLPEELKYSRIVLVTRALIASAMGSETEYRRALKDVNEYFGDDPTLSLMLIDHYFNERDYKAAHKALDRLHAYTGGDAAIDFLRANTCLTEKKYSESIRYAQTAIKQDPSFEDPYWTLLSVSVYSKRYAIAISTLTHLELLFGYQFDPGDIARIKGYEEFAGSSIFAEWEHGKSSVMNK